MQAARARRASNDRGGVVYRRGCIVQHHFRVERNVVPRTNPSMSKHADAAMHRRYATHILLLAAWRPLEI